MKATLPQRAWTLGIHYRRELHRYLLRRLRRHQDLDDLKQEVYMRLLRMDRMECIREPLAYLYSIAANVVADFTLAERRRYDRVTPDSDAVEHWADDPAQALPDDIAERTSLERELESALNQLPPLQAAALVLHYQEGLSCEEIAKKLGLSPKSVDKYLARAKARMRILLWSDRS
jgi:RNA polymerase sigma factor (sigma-70 family)